jgi:hypothetical protein
MNRIAESFKIEVLYINGAIKIYEIPFRENIDISKEDYNKIIDGISADFQQTYKEKVGACFYGEDIHGTKFVINMSQTCCVEFYI